MPKLLMDFCWGVKCRCLLRRRFNRTSVHDTVFSGESWVTAVEHKAAVCFPVKVEMFILEHDALNLKESVCFWQKHVKLRHFQIVLSSCFPILFKPELTCSWNFSNISGVFAVWHHPPHHHPSYHVKYKRCPLCLCNFKPCLDIKHMEEQTHMFCHKYQERRVQSCRNDISSLCHFQQGVH